MSRAAPQTARGSAPAAALISPAIAHDEREPEYRPIQWEICKRLLVYMWRRPGLQALAMGQAAGVALINAAVPVAMTETIRITIEAPEQWRIWSGGADAEWGLLAGTLLVGVLALLHYGMVAWRQYTATRMAEHVVFDMRADMFDHVQRLDMAYFDRTRLGRILARATGDISALRGAVVQVVPRLIIHGLTMALMFGAMLYYDWALTLMLAAFAPLIAFGNTRLGRRLEQAYRVVQESYSRMTASVAETVAGIRVTQGFAREGINAQLFDEVLMSHRRNNMRAAVAHGLYLPLLDVSSQVIAATILGLGAWRIASGQMGVADLIGFLLYSGGFFGSALILADLYSTTLAAMAGGERVFALLDTKPTIVDPPESAARELPLDAAGVGARVEFESVTFGYRDAAPVLHDVSFTLEPGRTIALVGHTGSGKTSIVNLVCRLYEYQAGEILIDGLDLRAIRLASLRSQSAMVSQDNFLFSGTVLDNIRFGRPSASDEEVRQACRDLGCLDILEGLPQGLATEVGERGGRLSLGQRQLVCFARAMLARPRLLILDEATSAVDTFTEHRIQQALERLMAGRSCLVIAHRLSTIRHADLILVLDHGCIVERGTHSELLRSGGHYATLYTQFIRLMDGAD